MRYYEGADYWVRYVEFPNMASESVVASHGDGTFTILINTLYSPERQQERLAHELRHLSEEHFYRDDLNITQIEQAADGASASSKPELPDVFFDHPPDQIACFHSLESMGNYVQKYLAQRRRKREELRSHS